MNTSTVVLLLLLVVVVAKLIKKVREPFRRHDFTTRLVFLGFFKRRINQMNDGIELLDGSVRSVRSVGLCRLKKEKKEKRVVYVRIPPDSLVLLPPIIVVYAIKP